jgi:hypothetical protein
MGAVVPDERSRVLVPVGDPDADRGAQFPGRAVAAVPQPAPDEVQPGAAGGREVQREAGTTHEPPLDRRGLVGRGVADDDVDVEPFRHAAVRKGRKRRDSSARRRPARSPITSPKATSRAAQRSVVPWRRQHSAACAAVPGSRHRTEAVRSRAPTSVVSSTPSRTAASGGFRQRPPTSCTFSMDCGSPENLKLASSWGFRPKTRQMRLAALRERSTCAASWRIVQRVAFRGASSSVLVSTRSTSASVFVRGPPGRGPSWTPPRRRSAKRPRLFPTVT